MAFCGPFLQDPAASSEAFASLTSIPFEPEETDILISSHDPTGTIVIGTLGRDSFDVGDATSVSIAGSQFAECEFVVENPFYGDPWAAVEALGPMLASNPDIEIERGEAALLSNLGQGSEFTEFHYPYLDLTGVFPWTDTSVHVSFTEENVSLWSHRVISIDTDPDE